MRFAGGPVRAALEAIALEAYRNDRLSEAEVRRLLAFETRMEVDAFLKEHGISLPYTYEDFPPDRDLAGEAAERTRLGRRRDPSDHRRAG